MQHGKQQRAFTFVEMVLTVFIIGVISGVTAKVLISGLDIYTLIVNRDSALQIARDAMDRMFEEILQLETSDIQFMSNTRFDFQDVDGHNTDFRRLTVNGTPAIYREGDFLAGNVTTLDFDYKRADGSETPWAALVRRVNVDVVVTGSGGDSGTVHLRSEVFPRSFMYDHFR